jgi:hypothetical protein
VCYGTKRFDFKNRFENAVTHHSSDKKNLIYTESAEEIIEEN